MLASFFSLGDFSKKRINVLQLNCQSRVGVIMSADDERTELLGANKKPEEPVAGMSRRKFWVSRTTSTRLI